MEIALSCPDCGFYERFEDNLGKHGNFFTNVSVGNLFGNLLAFQFSDWLQKLPGEIPPLNIVECGAHNAVLAKDILTWLRTYRPEIFVRLKYFLIEPSVRHIEWQKEKLNDFDGTVYWKRSISELRGSSQHNGFRGIIFSNELLDAMPVHRIGWDANLGEWFEWGVGEADRKFVWTRLPSSTAKDNQFEFPRLAPELLRVLPHNFTMEIGAAAARWWRDAARVLESGYLLTIDYGLTDEEIIMPERSRGTLRTYFNHQIGDDPLADPGERDITAHVNFSAIQSAGEAEGLSTSAFVSQEEFLTDIARQMAAESGGALPWNASERRQFQTLTHPEHLGRKFRVLIQHRVS